MARVTLRMLPSFTFEPDVVAPPASVWWRRLHAETAACVRLWCFPGIGAGTAIWRPWLEHLNGAGDVIAICLPGREARLKEAPRSRLLELSRALAAELAPALDERDVFCGHGFGGLLAFETARRLREQGALAPRGLVVCGSRPPHEPWTRRPLHRLSSRPFLEAVERRFGAIPAEFHDDPEFLELLLLSLRADLEALETYRFRAEPPLTIPLLAMAGRDDPFITPRALLGWARHTTSRFETARVAGGHFAVSDRPGAAARRVRSFLATL